MKLLSDAIEVVQSQLEDEPEDEPESELLRDMERAAADIPCDTSPERMRIFAAIEAIDTITRMLQREGIAEPATVTERLIHWLFGRDPGRYIGTWRRLYDFQDQNP